MRVKLLKDARVTVKAGETVDVSPVIARYLISVKLATPAAKPAKKKTDEK